MGTPTIMRTARYVIGERSLSKIVHQVRRAEAVWFSGRRDPVIHVTTLCGLPIGGGRQAPTFAHAEADLPGAHCARCQDRFGHLTKRPAWSVPPGGSEVRLSSSPRTLPPVPSLRVPAQLRDWLASGQALKIRQQAGVSRAHIARLVEVSEGAVWRWEHGERVPTGRNVGAYYAVLKQLAGATS